VPPNAVAQQAAATPRPVGVTLTELLAEAEQNHPAILAARKMAEAKRLRVSQAKAFPDPEIVVGYMGDPAPFKTQAGDPSSYRQFGVMQEIPYPGKRALRGEIAAKEASAEGWSVEVERRRIRAELKQSYYELAAMQKSIELTEKNRSLLEKIARIAEERYKVGQGIQADLLRAQMEVTRIAQRLTVLEQRRATQEAQINSLLLRPPKTQLGPVASVEKQPLAYTLEELLEKATANHPAVRRQDDLMEQSRLAGALAQKTGLPDFSVGWDYQNRPDMPEMYGLRFTMSLPFFNKGWRRDAVAEAASLEAGARHMREAVRTTLLFQVKEQYLAARASEELLNLYAKALMPQSALAVESAMASYQVGKLDFASLIAGFVAVREYEQDYWTELAAFQKALARLEELTGIELDVPQSPGATQNATAVVAISYRHPKKGEASHEHEEDRLFPDFRGHPAEYCRRWRVVLSRGDWRVVVRKAGNCGG
jgi:outer membrane protein TolC